jgi:hypothetical protein
MRRALARSERTSRDQPPAAAVATTMKTIDGLTFENSQTPLNPDGKPMVKRTGAGGVRVPFRVPSDGENRKTAAGGDNGFETSSASKPLNRKRFASGSKNVSEAVAGFPDHSSVPFLVTAGTV